MTIGPTLAHASVAAIDAVDSYRRGMYGPPPGQASYVKPIVIGLSILAVLWCGVYFYDRWTKKQLAGKKRQRSLFGDLCSTHGLTVKERQSLEALAAQQQVEPAAAIFIRPELVQALMTNSSNPELWQSIHEKAYGDWE